MHIYFCGLGGVGIGPLAEIAHDAGYSVSGSDKEPNLMTQQLEARGISVSYGQDGAEIARIHDATPIDWFVYSQSVPPTNPERAFAADHGIRSSKRDELLATIIREKNLRLLAVAGTHGKTTTTGMLVWLFRSLGLPVSYSVGTTLSFAPSGAYDDASRYFVYECDEYDRNFLHFAPYASVFTAVDYDHPDTYPTKNDYVDAFVQFMEQSESSLMWRRDFSYLSEPETSTNLTLFDELVDLSFLTLPGDHMRHNAYLALQAMKQLRDADESLDFDDDGLLASINSFPGTDRRFEKLADNLYSDYGHHPREIAATLQLAREIAPYVVLVYQPHQNTRQHEIRDDYRDSMSLADDIYWLPTYLTRENPDLAVLTPEELTAGLTHRDRVHVADLDNALWHTLSEHRRAGHLVLAMGAGTIDGWLRAHLARE